MKIIADVYRLQVTDLQHSFGVDADGKIVSNSPDAGLAQQRAIPGVTEKALGATHIAGIDSAIGMVRFGYAYDIDGQLWLIPEDDGSMTIRVGSTQIKLQCLCTDPNHQAPKVRSEAEHQAAMQPPATPVPFNAPSDLPL